MANVINTNIVWILILASGTLPALLWLWFWLKEDRHPEPKKILALTFIAGMVAVLFALPIENIIFWAGKNLKIEETFWGLIILIFLWALVEETLKYLAAKYAALKRASFDEPIDALIYMITAAVGFAVLENIFFLTQAFKIDIISGLVTSNLRFMGAILLHISTSSIVGASIGFSFFHKEHIKRNVIGGVLLATILHFIFNYLIIINADENVLGVFAFIWALTIVVIFVFERVKKINK